MEYTIQELADEIERVLNELKVKAKEKFNVDMEVTLSFDLKGVVAGRARYSTNTITLNKEMVKRVGFDMIHDTLPHEFGHLLAHKIYGNRIQNHGNEWRHVGYVLGYEFHTKHEFEVVPCRKISNHYVLPCGCEFNIGSIQHDRIQNGKIYRCTKHKVELKPSYYKPVIIADIVNESEGEQNELCI
jgi:SprT protein